jgi:hypothetical protein
MPDSVTPSRPKPSPVVAPADAFLPPPPVVESSPPLAAFAVGPVLRVGDYEVGETFCPRLCGHPDIRY